VSFKPGKAGADAADAAADKAATKAGDGAATKTGDDAATKAGTDDGAVAAGKTKQPKVNSDGRFEVKDLDDVKALRRNPPKMPGGLSEADQKLWKQYEEYYAKRCDQMEARLKAGEPVEDLLPGNFDKYKESRAFFDKLSAHKDFQEELKKGLTEEFPGAEVEIDVGMKKGKGNVKFADVVVARTEEDALVIDAFSCKQRDFAKFADVATDDALKNELQKVVQKDIEEALDKYAGKITIRREGFPGFGVPMKLEEVTLVYDSRLVPTEELKQMMIKQVENQTYRKTITIKLRFYP